MNRNPRVGAPLRGPGYAAVHPFRDAFPNPGPVDGNARFWGAADGRTAAEIVEFTGCSILAVRAVLQRLANQGNLEVVKVRRPALDGRLSRVAAYRFKAGKGPVAA